MRYYTRFGGHEGPRTAVPHKQGSTGGLENIRQRPPELDIESGTWCICQGLVVHTPVVEPPLAPTPITLLFGCAWSPVRPVSFPQPPAAPGVRVPVLLVAMPVSQRRKAENLARRDGGQRSWAVLGLCTHWLICGKRTSSVCFTGRSNRHSYWIQVVPNTASAFCRNDPKGTPREASG